MINFKKNLISIVIVSGIALSSPVSANTIIDNWYLDLTGAGAGKTTGIGNLVLSGGTGTVTQDYGADKTLNAGDTFTEFGTAFSVTYTPDTAVGTLDTGIGFLQPTGTQIDFTFTGLTGFVSSVDPATGQINYQFDNFATNPAGNINMTVNGVSVFDMGIASPSGGDIGQFQGGLAASGTTDLLLFARPGLGGSALSTIWGDTLTNLPFDMYDLLGNVATLFDVHLVNTLTAAGSSFNYVNGIDASAGTNSAVLNITSTGNLNLVSVPEPTSLALLGLGLLGLGATKKKLVI